MIVYPRCQVVDLTLRILPKEYLFFSHKYLYRSQKYSLQSLMIALNECWVDDQYIAFPHIELYQYEPKRRIFRQMELIYVYQKFED